MQQIVSANLPCSRNMKLLFDQNLSPHLPRRLADIYAESVHVRVVGLRDASDAEIWQYAKAEGYTIVSKRFRFSTAQSAAWRSSKIHLAKGWKLFSVDYRGSIATLFRGDSYFRYGPHNIPHYDPITKQRILGAVAASVSNRRPVTSPRIRGPQSNSRLLFKHDPLGIA